ncbi:MAG: glycyl-radical enzyme activating protein [Clostridiales bacterium]|nr:glycyl-radical enzyme activating protein [Clostridiales bacterium]
MKGYIMQLQPFSVNDGDGIRTTIFMAGCPLRCKWCSNPEGFTPEEKVGWYQRKCIGCGSCVSACPQGIDIDMNKRRADCIACGRCVEACPEGSRAFMVTYRDADDIIREIHKHRLFYAYSGGGITFSGGEAASQPELLDYLSGQIYDLGYSMDIESCGYFDFDRVRPSLERMDMIFMDLKMMDPDRHEFYTGVRNDRILDNIRKLADLDAEIVIRIPVIGGVNDDEDNIRSSAAYVHDNVPQAAMELLPYHRYGKIKYEALGISYDHPEFFTPSREQMDHLRRIAADQGVRIADFR